MNQRTRACQRAWMMGIVTSLALGFSAALPAKDKLPEVSPEGLQLQKSRDARAVYLKPGATFDQYKRVSILDCFVEFDKDWQRNYNENEIALEHRVTAADMDRMKAALSAEFKKVFTKELEKKGGYEVVDTAAPDVLVLRPALVNLVVNAPDLRTADMSRTVVASAGQMTLYLELLDSTSSTLLARVMDAQADQGMGGFAQSADSVTNKAAADRVLKEWADKLRKHLDAVHKKAAGP
jgi:hypothetical protein